VQMPLAMAEKCRAPMRSDHLVPQSYDELGSRQRMKPPTPPGRGWGIFRTGSGDTNLGYSLLPLRALCDSVVRYGSSPGMPGLTKTAFDPIVYIRNI
jgi:hypothetical protein